MWDESLWTLPFSTSFSSTFRIKDKFWKQNNEGNKMTQFWKLNVLLNILFSNVNKSSEVTRISYVVTCCFSCFFYWSRQGQGLAKDKGSELYKFWCDVFQCLCAEDLQSWSILSAVFWWCFSLQVFVSMVAGSGIPTFIYTARTLWAI